MWARFSDYPSITPTFSFNKFPFSFYFLFILLLTLFYTDHLVSIAVFNYDYLNSMRTLSICFNSLYHHFVNLNFICNYDNLYIRLSFYIRHWGRNHRFQNIFVNNFKQCDIDAVFLSQLQVVFWYIYIYIYIYIYVSIHLPNSAICINL